jgi:proton-translocating NAD(P)+ transhydrogenase subunit alpha
VSELMVAVGKESGPDENRVALVPDQIGPLRAAGLAVRVESGAGARAWFDDDAYARAGAEVVSRAELAAADIVVAVDRPAEDLLRQTAGQVVVGMLAPLADPGYAQRLARRGITAVSLDCLPRILSRAQPMDALTSQANVAGYKAVLVAANAFGRFFPMLVTAAGTARPARVLVLGAGVAGLQAMGTARRLGAVVSGYDIRSESRSEVESVGATFLDLSVHPPGSGEGGYARALVAGEQRSQQDALAEHIARHDVVITTAQVPGRRPPVLVSEDALKQMAAGSVVVDLAAGPLGGNVALGRRGETVVTDEGVTVVGAANLASTVPTAASAAYSRNVTALLLHLVRDGALTIDLTDELQAGVVITHDGRVVHPVVARLLDGGTDD